MIQSDTSLALQSPQVTRENKGWLVLRAALYRESKQRQMDMLAAQSQSPNQRDRDMYASPDNPRGLVYILGL